MKIEHEPTARREHQDVEEWQETETWVLAQLLIESRRNVSPKRLVDPGPTREQLESLLALAAAAPDHGMETPWRFVLIPIEQRRRLAEAFALALAGRDPGASVEQFEAARQKAFRAPLILVAAACLAGDKSGIPLLERMVSMGAAIQNVLLGAQAMGFSSGLTSGRAMSSPHLHSLCGLDEGQVPVCCINIGTVAGQKGARSARPRLTDFFRETPRESSAHLLRAARLSIGG